MRITQRSCCRRSALALIVLWLAAGCTTDSFISNSDGRSDAPLCSDTDGDGISDEHEGAGQQLDTDGDKTPDFEDLDSDGDQIPDQQEHFGMACSTPSDSDSDGKPNFQDLDSDDNKIPDQQEGQGDQDQDTIPDFADDDDDGDMIPDTEEIGPDHHHPLDTDGDKQPDFRDTDADGDGIDDLYESAADSDKDGTPNFRDQDSDDDTLPDVQEKGGSYPPPVDTDGDGQYDFLDADSDDDGLSDKDEAQTYHTDPLKGDTDGDGVSDMIETLDPKYDPLDPKKNPKAVGDFVFIMEYQAPPQPPQDTLDFATDISQGDVFFMVDTTGSMSGEITNLSSSLNSIVNDVNKVIPSTAFGVALYEDFPTGSYGKSYDFPFKLLHRVLTTTTPAGLSSVKSGIAKLSPATGGGDGPESGWEALFQTATGNGVSVGNAAVPAFSAASAPPVSLPAGETAGTIGGAGFRQGSMPIVIWATDASSHDSGGHKPYSFSGSASSTAAIAELKKIGARVIGVLSSGGYETAQAKTDLTKAATDTGALVPAAAFGGAGSRPSGCSVSQCCTGLNGVGEAPNSGGQCPLVFNISSSGTGLGQSIVAGISKLVAYAKIDITSVALDDPTDAVDVLQAFIDRIEVHNVSSTTPQCTGGLQVADTAPPGDGVMDTYQQVQPATPVCFDVKVKQNTTVKPTTTPQLFRATIEVLGDGKAKLSQRQVFFVVPPKIPVVPGPG